MFKTRGLRYPPETEIDIGAGTGMDLKAKDAETELKLKSPSDIYLISEVKNGSGDAFRILSERYNYIISYNISKFYASFRLGALKPKAEREDLFQECRIILYKAAKRYDFKRDAKFSTYSNICVKNYLISLMRKYVRSEKYSGCDFVPLDDIGENESGRYDRYFAFNDLPSFLEALETIKTADKMTFPDNLTALEKKVFMMYIENKSYKYMAEALNKSVKSIDNAVCRVKSKLKPYAEYFVSEY